MLRTLKALDAFMTTVPSGLNHLQVGRWVGATFDLSNQRSIERIYYVTYLKIKSDGEFCCYLADAHEPGKIEKCSKNGFVPSFDTSRYRRGNSLLDADPSVLSLRTLVPLSLDAVEGRTSPSYVGKTLNAAQKFQEQQQYMEDQHPNS